MRKIVTFLLVMMLLIPTAAFAESAERDFVTRAELARVVARMYNVEIELAQRETCLVDISEHWAYEYVRFLEQRDVIRGDGYGYFRPDDEITFAETLAMITRAMRYAPMARGQGGFPTGYMIAAVTTGIAADINIQARQNDDLITRDLLYALINSALDAPFMQRNPGWGGEWERTSFQSEYWDDLPVYFDGENFVVLSLGPTDGELVTRAEFAQAVVQLLELETRHRVARNPFIDVPTHYWANSYLGELSRWHIIDIGFPRPLRFRPDEAIVVEDALDILVRALRLDIRTRENPDGYGYAPIVSQIYGVEFTHCEYLTRELLPHLIDAARNLL